MDKEAIVERVAKSCEMEGSKGQIKSVLEDAGFFELLEAAEGYQESERRVKMIKVTCRVETYNEPNDAPSMLVHSHWNENKKVTLEIDGNKYTVVAHDLIEAVKNCTNTARFG